MATVMDSVSIKGLRKTHFEQLLTIVQESIRTGGYYGNRKLFYARNADLQGWLEGIINSIAGDVIIPKK